MFFFSFKIRLSSAQVGLCDIRNSYALHFYSYLVAIGGRPIIAGLAYSKRNPAKSLQKYLQVGKVGH